MKQRFEFTGIKVTALAGGVGGARLANGLAQVISPPDALTVIVNTGDDFEHLGLRICPDLDTVCYTLAGLGNPLTGWGRQDETWTFMEQVRQQSLPDWFNIGDKDRQTHQERTQRLAAGETLTQVTQAFCRQWGIEAVVLPMTDDPTPTMVETIEYGWLGFQEYFVQHHCEPIVKSFAFPGHMRAKASPSALRAITESDLIVFCPSNPWVSLDPILKLAGMRAALAGKRVIGVSPIIGGKAIKGPAAKMYAELGFDPSAENVALHFRDHLTDFVIDTVDHALADRITGLGISCLVTDTLMTSSEKQADLAASLLAFATRWPA